jgi:hypothetical protein
MAAQLLDALVRNRQALLATTENAREINGRRSARPGGRY